MSQETPPTPAPSFGRRMLAGLAAFLKALVRLVVILAVLALLGFGIFYLLPTLYQRYVQPYQIRIQELEYSGTQQAQTNQQLQQEIDELQGRLDALERRSDTVQQVLDEARPSLESALGTQEARLAALEGGQKASLAEYRKIQSALAALEERTAALASRLEGTQSELTTLARRLQAEGAPVAVLRREVQILKAMELLTRSRLFLVENNLGLAEADIRAARELLGAMQVPEGQRQALADVLVRLDLAQFNLPESPVLAAEDLEVAWQLLQRGFPGIPPPPTSTAQAAPEATYTPSAPAPMTPTATP